MDERHLPQARTEDVVSEYVGDELVVYDELTQTAHSLSAAASQVWVLCDGQRSSEAIAEELGLEPAIVAQAVAELGECGLMDDSPFTRTADGISRREAAKRFAKAGGAALAAPLIYSVAIQPALAMASTCSVSVGHRPAHCTAAAGTFGSSVQAGGLSSTCCSSGKCYQGKLNKTYYCVAASETCRIYGQSCSGTDTCCDPTACTGGTGGDKCGE